MQRGGGGGHGHPVWPSPQPRDCGLLSREPEALAGCAATRPPGAERPVAAVARGGGATRAAARAAGWPRWCGAGWECSRRANNTAVIQNACPEFVSKFVGNDEGMRAALNSTVVCVVLHRHGSVFELHRYWHFMMLDPDTVFFWEPSWDEDEMALVRRQCPNGRAVLHRRVGGHGGRARPGGRPAPTVSTKCKTHLARCRTYLAHAREDTYAKSARLRVYWVV
jgi:hypothetical protein